MPKPGQSTLAHVLLDHRTHRGDQVAFEYLADDDQVHTITYADLHARASAAASRIRGHGPVLLLYPPGLDFVVAVWACLLAGVPAVPAYPPLFGPADRVTQRFARVLADSRARALVADPDVLAVLTAAGAPADLPPVITLDDSAPAEVDLPTPDTVALVQYTSGSTSTPKGVVLTHGNLLANVRAITEVFELDTSARVISWLPPYHDMGLIGFILTPVYGGFPARLMSPVRFLRNPLDWLRQISSCGITHTGGPNFGYDLCVRRARTVDLSDLDLSTWRVAFNGAEPIRRRTLESFSDRFALNGFKAESFLPCYGLAEATLIVTGRHWAPESSVDERGRIDCGPVISGHQLSIVDPSTSQTVDTEGEIWVAGPSISGGYWTDTGSADGTLDGQRYLRTGDLGYLRDGHLFVTGRLKDVVVQNGVNHHAHDLEAAALDGDEALRPIAAAFGVDSDLPELVLAVEMTRRDTDAEAVAARVRERVLTETGARVDVVLVCPPRTIPLTTSGKVQRRLARRRYLDGELGGQALVHDASTASAAAEPVELFLASIFAAVCEVAECAPTQELSSIGGDSVRAAEIASVTEDALTLPVPVDVVLRAQSPRVLAAQLLTEWARTGVADDQVVARIGALRPATT